MAFRRLLPTCLALASGPAVPTGQQPLVFVAMMFGATLGGDATLIGASANVVAAGIRARKGQRPSFGRFPRHGLPIAAFQLILSALYALAMFRLRG